MPRLRATAPLLGPCRVLLLGLVGVLALAACDDGKRRFAASCQRHDECESGVCWHGRCSKACVNDSECGDQLCLDQKCQPKDTPCDDGDPCTAGDGWVKGVCTPGGPLQCPASTDACVKQTCFSEGNDSHPAGCLPETAQTDNYCDAAQTRTCGAGGPNSNGCRCALWQGHYGGPFDDKASGLDGHDTLHGAVAVGPGMLAVGATKAPDGTEHGWALRVIGTNHVLWNRAFAGPAPTPKVQRLRAVAVAQAGGWLAVGQAAQPGDGWLLRLGPNGDPLWQQRLPPQAMTEADLRAVAPGPDGGWLAAGVQTATGGEKPWQVRISAQGEVTGQALTLPAGVTATLGRWQALAALPDGWLAAGVAGQAGARMGLLARLDAAGGVVWAQAHAATGAAECGFDGVALGTAGAAVFGWAQPAGTAPRRGWVAQVDLATGKLVWQETPVLEDAYGYVAGALAADGQWLAVGVVGSDGLPLLSVVGEQQIGSFNHPKDARSLVALLPAQGAYLLVGNYRGAGATPNTQVADGLAARMTAGGADKCAP